MRTGTAIRVAIVTTWLGLFGWHVVRHVAPGLGSRQRDDIGRVLGEHLDQTLTYRVRWHGDSTRDLGESTLWFTRVENRFRIEQRLRLDDLAPLLAPFGLGTRAGGTLDLQVDTVYDDRFRLAEVEGHVALDSALMTTEATFAGKVDYRGLALHCAIAGQRPRDLVIGDIARDGETAQLSVPTLPPGLRAGDRFTTAVIDPRELITSGGSRARTLATMRVASEDLIATAAGPMRLLRVTCAVAGRTQSTLWCDAKGLIYQMLAEGMPVTIELVHVRSGDGTQQWPGTRR